MYGGVVYQYVAADAKSKWQAEAWQPWRAYGLMYVWYAGSGGRAKASSEKKARVKQTGVKQRKSNHGKAKQGNAGQTKKAVQSNELCIQMEVMK